MDEVIALVRRYARRTLQDRFTIEIEDDVLALYQHVLDLGCHAVPKMDSEVGRAETPAGGLLAFLSMGRVFCATAGELARGAKPAAVPAIGYVPTGAGADKTGTSYGSLHHHER